MNRNSTRTTLAVLTALIGLVLAGSAAQAGDSEAAKPMIVKIHADWCGTCTKLNPTMAALEEQVGTEALIVTLDVTDRDAVARSQARAAELGIVVFFDEYKGKTGTIAVLDAQGNAVSILKGETDTDKYVAALKKAQEA